MADIVTRQKRSAMMAAIGSKNSKPELLVRKVLHGAGFRFRLHKKGLPGRPDIVLPKWNALVFVHGCFWHGHEDCPLFRLPKSRTEFWDAKIRDNKRRDAVVREACKSGGWRIVEVWECALKGKSRLDCTEFTCRLTSAIVDTDASFHSIRGSQTR